MNFLGAVLKSIDGLWSLVTIPAVMFGVAAFVNFLPIPTLIVMAFFIRVEFFKARIIVATAGMSSMSEEKIDELRRNCVGNGIILTIATVLAYGLWIYWVTSRGGLCNDASAMVPFSLPEILKVVIPHSC